MRPNPFQFGQRSTEQLVTCSLANRRILRRAIEITTHDFTIVWGHRGEAAQNEAYRTGASQKMFPDSVHNTAPSEAFDVAPWRIHPVTAKGYIPWKDEGAFYKLAGVIEAAASLEGETLRHGGDWDRDGLTEDQNFHDLGHFERVT